MDELFSINEKDPNNLNQEDYNKFHQVTTNILYLDKRARPDPQLGVIYLFNRVKYTDKYDRKNLTRVHEIHLIHRGNLPNTWD